MNVSLRKDVTFAERQSPLEEAKNQDGGFANIRKAATTHRELAAVMMKMPAELLGLLGDFLQSVRVKAVEKFHPEIQEAWQRAEDLRDVAGKFTSLIDLPAPHPVAGRQQKTTERLAHRTG